MVYRHQQPVGRGRWLALGLIVLGYTSSFFVFGPPLYERPMSALDKMPFLAYGLLSVLVHRALSLDVRTPWSYLATVASVAALGVADENIQYYLLPNRVFEWKDALINVDAAVLATALIWVLRPIGAASSESARELPERLDRTGTAMSLQSSGAAQRAAIRP